MREIIDKANKLCFVYNLPPITMSSKSKYSVLDAFKEMLVLILTRRKIDNYVSYNKTSFPIKSNSFPEK